MTAFCGRKYDELTINKAIAKAVEEDKSVYLLGGNYRIDDFYDFGDGGDRKRQLHKTVCSTAERLSYYPSLGEQIFDTDLNKLLIYIDADTKKWVDANGVQITETLL